MSYTGHQLSGRIGNETQPVVDVTSHVPVARLHCPEEEVLFPNLIKGITQSNLHLFKLLSKTLFTPVLTPTLTVMMQLTLFFIC